MRIFGSPLLALVAANLWLVAAEPSAASALTPSAWPVAPRKTANTAAIDGQSVKQPVRGNALVSLAPAKSTAIPASAIGTGSIGAKAAPAAKAGLAGVSTRPQGGSGDSGSDRAANSQGRTSGTTTAPTFPSAPSNAPGAGSNAPSIPVTAAPGQGSSN